MSDQDRSVRLVLEAGFVNGPLQERIKQLQWPFLYEVPPKNAAATEYVWQIDGQHSFHLLELVDYPFEYCMVVGPDANATLTRVSAHLEFLDASDLAAAFDRSSTASERRALIVALGVSAVKEPDDTIASRIHIALTDADPAVRRAAIDAAFLSGWPIFQSQLEKVADSDPDLEVSAAAMNALEPFGSDS